MTKYLVLLAGREGEWEAATDEQRRSALIIVRTGGQGAAPSSSSPSSPTRAGSVSQSWLPSRSTRSGTTAPSCAMARCPASRSAAMMPIASISSGQACSTAQATATCRTWAASASRWAGVSCLLSRKGYSVARPGRITAATVTGPAQAPRPASSTPATRK